MKKYSEEDLLKELIMGYGSKLSFVGMNPDSIISNPKSVAFGNFRSSGGII